MAFAGVWCREKLSGGQAEVEHCHLIHHLPRLACRRGAEWDWQQRHAEGWR